MKYNIISEDQSIYFKVNFEYDRAALAKIVYEIDEKNLWDGYIPPSWDEKKYTINNFTAVSYRYYENLQNLEPIKTIRECLNFSYLDYKSTQLVKFPAWNGPTIHRDTERETAVLFPIYTTEDYVPIDFYDDLSKEIKLTVDYKENVIFFDAKKLHASANKEHHRYSLQFDIREKYSDVLKMIKEGNLFKC
jgi:hypothetical protein